MLAQNRIVQFGSIALLAVVVLVIVANSGGKVHTTEQPIAVGGGEAMTPEMAAALRIEGDTEGDTVRTLIAEVKKLRDESDRLSSENSKLRTSNSELKQMERRIGSNVEADMEVVRDRVQAQLDAKVESLEDQLRSLEARAQQVQRENRSRWSSVASSTASATPAAPTGGITWVQPLGGAVPTGAPAALGEGGSGLLGFLDSARNGADDKLELERLTGRKGQRYGEAQDPVRPVYTLPKNATLVNSTALTALVGRVPLGGQVTDPYLFKVIIGRDNLAANGIEVPGVSYSVASGQAVGDWTLGCVRGTLYSMTFVFEDGTIRTVPKADSIYEGGGGSTSSNTRAIGELSDELGNPCVVGQRITNAYSYLAQRIGVVGVAAAAEAAAASQTTQATSVGGGGVTTSTTVDGSTGDYVLGRTLADGSREVASWLDARQSQQFDAVYVPPGATVAIHITEQIDIDYDPAGRRTTYAGLGAGGYRALD
ncbi:MAG: TIGR03752 family integrating conjugative element protein [Parahaliea sp.]